jgi:hypothetical protein
MKSIRARECLHAVDIVWKECLRLHSIFRAQRTSKIQTYDTDEIRSTLRRRRPSNSGSVDLFMKIHEFRRLGFCAWMSRDICRQRSLRVYTMTSTTSNTLFRLVFPVHPRLCSVPLNEHHFWQHLGWTTDLVVQVGHLLDY